MREGEFKTTQPQRRDAARSHEHAIAQHVEKKKRRETRGRGREGERKRGREGREEERKREEGERERKREEGERRERKGRERGEGRERANENVFFLGRRAEASRQGLEGMGYKAYGELMPRGEAYVGEKGEAKGMLRRERGAIAKA